MKINVTVASIFLALVGAAGANAQTSAFDVTVSPTPQTWTGSPLIFGGTITNTSTSTLNIDTDSVNPPTGVTYTDEFGSLAGPLPLTLAAGASTGFIPDLFTITGGVTSSFTGTFSATDSSTGPAPVTGFGNFDVVVPGSVPEPGSVALFASSLVGGGLFLRRRRK